MLSINMTNRSIIIVGGPTASGKSNFAMVLAEKTPAVIINADSMQVYHELPILTAQPTQEEKAKVPHELYGVLSASESCSVARWIEMAKEAINKTLAAEKTPILVGGTGMYIKSLIYGIAPIPDIEEEIREQIRSLHTKLGPTAFHKLLMEKDPITAAKLEPGDTQRNVRAMEVFEQTHIPLSEWQQQSHIRYFKPKDFSGYFLNPPREILYEKINHRLEHMVRNGAFEEVKVLKTMHLPPYLPAMKAHGVPEFMKYLEGTLTLEEVIKQAQQNTRNYAKRQVTWFRHQLPLLKEVTDI